MNLKKNLLKRLNPWKKFKSTGVNSGSYFKRGEIVFWQILITLNILTAESETEPKSRSQYSRGPLGASEWQITNILPLMTNRLLNIGLISNLTIIIIQIFSTFYETLGIKNLYLEFFIIGMNSVLNISVLIILWNVLVKFYKQNQLDIILKSIIIILFIVSLLSFMTKFDLEKIGFIFLVALSLINVILYFVFIHRVMEIDKSEISQIEQLKNYGLAFVICLFGQFILSAVIELTRHKNLNFVNHFLIIIPMIFIGLFFLKTRNETRQKWNRQPLTHGKKY